MTADDTQNTSSPTGRTSKITESNAGFKLLTAVVMHIVFFWGIS
jgi:hypothetical protein